MYLAPTLHVSGTINSLPEFYCEVSWGAFRILHCKSGKMIAVDFHISVIFLSVELTKQLTNIEIRWIEKQLRNQVYRIWDY